jgi:hypothetical protein
MQTDQRSRPVAVLFDSSLGDGIEQVLALATLLASDTAREARLGALTVSRHSLEIAAFADLMVRFYRGEEPGTGPEGASIPVGMSDPESALDTVPPIVAAVVDRAGAGGAPLYPRAIQKLNDTADPVAVLRNALTAQPDQTAVIVLSGPPVNLLGLLALPEGPELVRRKARELVVASRAEGDSFSDLFDAWPGPVVLSRDDLNVSYPAMAVEQDFGWAMDHPFVDAYRASGAMGSGIPAYAAAAVLHAVHPDEYFSLSDAEGDRPAHRRLTADAFGRDRAGGAIRELVAARPPEPRRGRGG